MKAFVVRLWTPSDEVEAHVHDAAALRGVVEQVGSGDAAPFRDEAELLGLLRESLRARTGADAGEGEGRR